MAVSGVAVTVEFLVWDTSANAGKTGDAANLTLRVIADGVSSTPSGTPAEVDATNCPGLYKLALTAGENTGTALCLAGKSATADVIVVPTQWHNADAAVSSRAAAATALSTSVWTNTKAGYIDAAISSLAGGTGAASITLYVKDGSSNPIAGASVTVPGAGTLTTSALGAVTFNLDDATYAVTVRSSASYTPAASYSVVVSSGAVTSPAGGILTVTAISLPDPASSECYALYNTETDENNVRFGASGVTVQVIDMTAAGKVDAVNGICRAIKGSTRNTDADGQWSMDIPIQAFIAGASLTLRRSWVDAAGDTQSDDWSAVLVAPSSGTQVCWASLSPSRA